MHSEKNAQIKMKKRLISSNFAPFINFFIPHNFNPLHGSVIDKIFWEQLWKGKLGIKNTQTAFKNT